MLNLQIGTKLWLFNYTNPDTDARSLGGDMIDQNAPFAAEVTWVYADNWVNASYLDHNGVRFSVGNVMVCDDTADVPDDTCYAAQIGEFDWDAYYEPVDGTTENDESEVGETATTESAAD